MYTWWKMGSHTCGLLVLQERAGETKNNSKNANLTSETKSEKDVSLIINVPSRSETALLCTETCQDVQIANSGASTHITNPLQGMRNQCKISSKVKIGSREYVDTNIIGGVSGIAVQKDGTKKDITQCNVKYVPPVFCKLISLTTIMNRGFKMTGNVDGIIMEKASTPYTLDQSMKSSDRELIGLAGKQRIHKPTHWKCARNPWTSKQPHSKSCGRKNRINKGPHGSHMSELHKSKTKKEKCTNVRRL